MRIRGVCTFAVVAAFGVGLPVGVAHATGVKVDTYSAAILNDDANSGPFAIGKSVSNVFTTTDDGSKVVIKTSNKTGDGGAFIQLILKGVDCAAYVGKDDHGNDGGSCSGGVCASPKPAKCGVGNHSPTLATPVMNHVLELDTTALGNTASEVGVTYNIDKGVASFTATGKNKVSAATAFAGLTGAVAGHPIFVDKVRLHAALWTCSTSTGTSCTDNSGCTSPETCNNGVCGAVCVQDADCSSGTCTNGQETTACASPHIAPDAGSGCFGGGTYAGAGFTVSTVQ